MAKKNPMWMMSGMTDRDSVPKKSSLMNYLLGRVPMDAQAEDSEHPLNSEMLEAAESYNSLMKIRQELEEAYHEVTHSK